MRYLFRCLPGTYLTYLTYDLGDWLDRQRQEQTETDRDRKKQTETETERQTEKPIPKVEIQPHTIFTQFFFPLSHFLFGNVRKKTRDDPKYMYLVRRVKV